MSFTASDEIIVSLNKDSSLGSCEAVVIKSANDRMDLALRGKGILVKPGLLLHMRSKNGQDVAAWGSVDQMSLAGDVKLISLKSVCYENVGLVRAARCEIDVALNANYSDRDQTTRRTAGQTLNISITGVRARFKTTVPEGTLVHMLLHVDAERAVEAQARVVRIVPGSESASGGFEVGLEFQRFLRGYEYLLDLVPSGEELPSQDQAA